MHKLIISFLFSLFFLPLSAQEYEVKSFDFDQTDLSARRNPRVDLNGKPCALIKVYTTDNIADVRGNVVGDISTVGMEKWVYVESGTKQLEFVFDSHKPLKVIFDDYNISEVSQKSTYVLDLQEVLPASTTTVAQSPEAIPSTEAPAATISEEEILKKMQKAYRDKDYSRTLELGLSIPYNPEAQVIIGDLYYNGFGVPKDYTEALKWYEPAALMKNPTALYMMGCFYSQGLGVTQDYTRALRWYQRAADLGDATAMANIAYYYKNGIGGLPQDYKMAEKWYKKAIDQGYMPAKNFLKELYQEMKK